MEQGLVQKLITSSQVKAIVGSSPVRVHWDRRPQASALPSITLSNVSGAPLYADDGTSGLVTRRVQIDCWAETDTEAKALGYAVARALKQPAMISAGFQFTGVFPENTIDFEDTELGAKPIYRRMLEYELWFYEEEL